MQHRETAARSSAFSMRTHNKNIVYIPTHATFNENSADARAVSSGGGGSGVNEPWYRPNARGAPLFFFFYSFPRRVNAARGRRRRRPPRCVVRGVCIILYIRPQCPTYWLACACGAVRVIRRVNARAPRGRYRGRTARGVCNENQ